MPAVLLQSAYAERAHAIAFAQQAGARGVAFLALEEPQQDNALIDTTTDINGLDFAGVPLSASQPMAFPRMGARPDALQRLAIANIEEAMARASSFSGDDGASDSLSASDVRGSVVEETIAVVTTKYAPVPGIIADGSLARFCDRARNQLSPLLVSSAAKVTMSYSGSGNARRVY